MWKTVKLGDICDISIGKTPSRGEKRYWDKEKQTENVWLSIADLTSINGRYVKDSKEYVSEEGANLFKSVPSDTLVMSFKLSIGKLAFTQRELRTNEAIAALPIKDESVVSKEFLYHYLSSLDWNLIAGKDEKVKGKTLNKKKLNALDVILPPLAEQQRIVAKLDAAFAEIDRAIEVVKQQMQQAHSLHQQKTDSAFGEIRGDNTTLNDVCDLITCGVAARPEYVEEGIPFLSAQNVKKGQVIYSNHKYITKEKHQELTKKNKPMRGDLLYTRVGSFGEAAVVESDIEFSIFVSLTLIKTKSLLNPYYLKHYLNSQRLKTLASNSLSGSGVGNLNVGTVRKFPITLPSIEQQLEVIESLNDLAESTERLYETYQSKAAQLQSLKSAILAQELQPPQSEAA